MPIRPSVAYSLKHLILLQRSLGAWHLAHPSGNKEELHVTRNVLQIVLHTV
jgi:hypothetical protein